MEKKQSIQSDFICLLGCLSTVVFFCVTMWLLVKTGYAADRGMYLPSVFCIAIWASLPVCILFFIFFSFIGNILLEKKIRKGKQVLCFLFIIMFGFELFAVGGTGISYYRLSKMDIIYSNYITTISMQELQKMMSQPSGTLQYVYIGRRSCPGCDYIKPDLVSFVETEKLPILYYSTEFDRDNQLEEMNSLLATLKVSSVPAIIGIEDGEVTECFEGIECVKKLREKLE